MRFLAFMVLAATIFNQSESARFTEVLSFGRGVPVSAAWSPDGETVLVNTAADTWLYTADLTDKAHLPDLRRAAFVAGGRYLAGYDPDNQFALYDATSLAPVTFNPAVTYAAFSAANQYLAGLDDNKNVRLWAVDDLSTPLELPAEFAIPAKWFFWSPVASQLAVHTLDGRLMFWTIGATEVDLIIDIPADSGISWSPDGKKLLVNDVNNKLTVYSAESGEMLLTIPTICDPLPEPEIEYTCGWFLLSWRPDSQQLMASVGIYPPGTYRTVFFDAISGEKQLEVGHDDPFHMIYSQDSQRVIINSSLLDTASSETLVRLNQGFYQVSPDGLTLAATFYFDGNITLFDLHTGEIKHRFENFPVNGINQFFWQTSVWSPDSQKLLIINHFAGVLTIHDVNTQQQLARTDAHLKLRLINFSDDGRYLAGRDYFGGVYLWDVQTPAKKPLYLAAHDNELSHLIWQPDGKLFATTTGTFPYGFRPDDGDVIRIWNGETGEQIALVRHPVSVTSIAWSLDGQYLASVSGTAFILWNAQEKKIQYRSTGDNVCLVLPRISTTPDPNILKINCSESSHSYSSILLWDIRTHERLTHFTPTAETVWDGEELRIRGGGLGCRNLLKLCNFKLSYFFGAGIPTIYGHELYSGEISTRFAMPGAEAINWSPDGEQILITTNYGQAQVWTADTMTLTSTFPLPADTPLIWSPDSTRVLLQNEDSSTIIDAATGDRLLSQPDLLNTSWQGNGSYLTGSDDETYWLIDATTGEQILTLPHGGLIWNTDETVFAIAGDQLTVWCEAGNC